MTRTFDPHDNPAAAGELAAKRENLGLPTGDEPHVVFVANREVRTVPKGWLHPEEAGRARPVLPDDMPSVAGLAVHETEIVAYETTTEGTPISPPFANTPEGRLRLVEHCAEHANTWGHNKADAEAWAAILFGQGAAVTANGGVVASDD